MILEKLKNEWDALKQEHVPLKTEFEIERIYSENLMAAARVGDRLGRELSDREIYDLTM